MFGSQLSCNKPPPPPIAIIASLCYTKTLLDVLSSCMVRPYRVLGFPDVWVVCSRCYTDTVTIFFRLWLLKNMQLTKHHDTKLISGKRGKSKSFQGIFFFLDVGVPPLDAVEVFIILCTDE